jgi:hypothetical protein
MSAVTRHFIDRAVERLGYRIPQAVELAEGLIWAIQNHRDDLAEFVARVDRQGCRLFRFRAADGRFYYALVDTEQWVCVTVLPAGFTVGRQGKSRLKLKEKDL